MKWLGLTGSIATGKTTVAQILRKSGYPVVDADQLAREVVASGSAGFKKIVEVFGTSIVQENGELNRKQLGNVIFADSTKRLELEQLVHPLVQERAKQLRQSLEKDGHAFAFYDVPLLFEKNLQANFDDIVVVACSPEIQLERLMKRNGYTQSEAKERINAQVAIEEKIKNANFVIWNNGSLDELSTHTVSFLKTLKKNHSR